MADFPKTSFYGEGQTDLRGPRGEPGQKGDQGDLGPRGPEGLPGAKGDPGTNGTNGKNAVYRFGMFATTGILAGEILMDHVVAQACTLGPDFAGSVASCGSPPEALWTGAITLNETPVGALEITPDGVATLSTLSPDPIPLVPLDVVTLTAPEPADAAIGRVRITLTGEL